MLETLRTFALLSLLTGAGLLIGHSKASLAAETITCPESFSGSQPFPKGFEVILPSKPGVEAQGVTPFTGIMMFNGHPKELASLVPDNEDASETKASRWTLKGGTYWVACRYGFGESLLLAKHLGSVKSFCTEQRVSKKESGNFRGLKCN
ncbi:MAG: STY0301 family protein [Bdellovibrionia bacterium]